MVRKCCATILASRREPARSGGKAERPWSPLRRFAVLSNPRGTLDRASPCVNHLPGHVPRRITGEEDYYSRGIIGLIDFRYSGRHGPFASH